MAQQTIDLVIIVDCDALLEACGPQRSLDSEAPMPVADDHVFVIRRGRSALKPALSGGRVTLRGPLGTALRLRERSTALGNDNFVILYRFDTQEPDTRRKQLIAPPALVIVPDCPRPIPNGDDPSQPIMARAPEAFWHSQVVAHGQATYPFAFMIADRDGVPQGYFCWKPILRISA
jgi:hypothetical protein